MKKNNFRKQLAVIVSTALLLNINMFTAYAVENQEAESYGLGAEKIINDNFSELKDLMKENDVLFPQDSTGEMNVKYEINCDENGNEYLDVTALYASENTNYQFEPITYNHEIAWTKLGVFIPDWEKVRIINGEEITAESGWYPIVKYYIEHSDSIRKDSAIDLSCGDINADGKVDISDLSELSLAIIGDKTLNEIQVKVADIDGNGKADLPDLARLRQYLSKVIDSLESVSKTQSDNSKVIWETPQPEQPGAVNINEKEIAYSLYVALNNEQNKGCLFAVTPVFKIDNQFEYNGKTIAQYEEESDAEYQYYLHIGELIKIGDSLKYGEALYTTGTPEGEKWDKGYYDNTIERLGKDLISKYIIDGEFFREEAEKVWNNQPPTVCYDALITARMEYQKHMNEETVKKLSEQNIEYEFNNKDQLIIFITSEEFKSLNLENVQQYMLATNDTIDFVDD